MLLIGLCSVFVPPVVGVCLAVFGAGFVGPLLYIFLLFKITH